MSTYSVYIHTNKIDGKKYVGVSKQTPVESRWRYGAGYMKNKHFYSAIKKYGWNNFDHFILEVDSEELMYKLEQQYIAYYKTTDRRYGYNKSIGGEKSRYFGKNSGTPEYIKEKNKRYRTEHKDEMRDKYRENRKEYYQKNKERIRDYHKEWREKNKEELRKKKHEYSMLHREENKEKCRRWYYSHKYQDIPPITPLW